MKTIVGGIEQVITCFALEVLKMCASSLIAKKKKKKTKNK